MKMTGKKRMWRGCAMGLCAALVLAGLCACGGNGNGDGDGGTATTVSTTATTAATTEETTTATETTETTTTTTTTTETPATAATTAAKAAETPQIGGDTFTLDGETFALGVSPDKILAHLGTPLSTKSTGGNPFWDGDPYACKYYFYDGVVVETVVQPETGEEFFIRIGFSDNRYAFDGITVGSTRKELHQVVDGLNNGAHPYETYDFVDLLPIDSTTGMCLRVSSKDYKTMWRMHFEYDGGDENRYISEGQLNLTDDAKICQIEIRYNRKAWNLGVKSSEA